MRKRLQGVEPRRRLGREGYNPANTAAVYRHLLERAATLLRAGRTVIVDATFLDPADRARVEKLAADLAIPFRGVWLDAPRGILERRISERRGDASDADLDVLARQLEREIGAMTWREVDACGDAGRIAGQIRDCIVVGRQRADERLHAEITAKGNDHL